MPVDLSIGNSVVRAFQAGQELKQRREEFATSEENKMKMQEKLFKQQQDLQKREQEFLRADHEAQRAMLAKAHADQNYFNLIRALGERQIQPQSTTQPIGPSPETNVPQQVNFAMPGAMGTYGTPMPIAPNVPQMTAEVPNAEQVFTMPSGDVVKVPAPPSLMDEVNRVRQLTGAKAEAETQAQLPLYDAKARLQLIHDTLQNQFTEQRDSKRYEAQMEMLTKRLESMEGMADKRMAAMLAGISMRMRDKQIDPETLAKQLPNLTDGTYTMEDLVKLGYKGEQRVALTEAALENDVKILNKDQQKQLGGLADVQNLFNSYKKLADIYGNAGLNINKRLRDPEVRALNATIDATLERIARTFGGSRGVITNKDAERMRGLKPEAITLLAPGTNQKKIQEVGNMLEGATNALLSGMTDSQQYSIRKKHGLSLNNFVKGPDNNWMKVEDIQ